MRKKKDSNTNLKKCTCILVNYKHGYLYAKIQPKLLKSMKLCSYSKEVINN
jgi:hypothetical protein